VETVVRDGVRGVNDQQVISDEHFEHGLREEEVDAAAGLRARAGPVEAEAVLAGFRQGAFDGEGSAAVAVVVYEVDEGGGFVGHMVLDDLAHGCARTLEQDVGGSGIYFWSETGAELAHAGCCCAAGGDERQEVGAHPFRLPAVPAHQLNNRPVHLPLLEELG